MVTDHSLVPALNCGGSDCDMVPLRLYAGAGARMPANLGLNQACLLTLSLPQDLSHCPEAPMTTPMVCCPR